MKDERNRLLLTSMVCCLFAREVYKEQLISDCLSSLGYDVLAGNMAGVANHIQCKRWQIRLASGYKPEMVQIPKRFTEVKNWKGTIDPNFIQALQHEYSKRIVALGKSERTD
jgi:aldehyde:ferredoxin oxidoreductase